jgi:hypothetical protein
MTQTAVEWLVSQIWKREPLEHEQKVIERAKEMEKVQTENLYTEEDLKILIGKIRSVLPEHNYNHYSIDYNGIIRSLKQK